MDSNKNSSQQENQAKNKIIKTGIIALVLGILIGFFIPRPQAKTASNTAVKSSSKQKSEYVDSVKELIKSKYYQPVDEKKLDNGSIKGMLDSLDDPYTTYLDKKEAQSLTDTISSSIVGIGITVLEKNKMIVIDSVLDGTPAKKSGLKANDVIIKVDGKSIVGKPAAKATKLIRGKKGTSVKITVKRGDHEANFKMERDTIPIETVKHKMLDKNIGYLDVSTFSSPTTDEFKKSIKDLRKSGAKKLVVDMRGNPGGELQQALSLSSMFLKDGQPIMQVQGRQKADLAVYRASKKLDGGFKITEPTVVLTDGDSASAAEIFTAALKNNKIKVVGKKTFGKGTVQRVVDLPDDAELKMTVAKWLTPDGTWINHKGIKPDYSVDYPKYLNMVFNEIKTPLKVGDVSSNVKVFQVGLTALGMHPGNEKGIFDEATENETKNFQNQRKINVNGTIDESTIQEMIRALRDLSKQQDPMQQKAVEILNN
ncbi:S41 family peptidase [Xylocopilactobacillus apicola]|uniref:Peptidase S41 n=1 Tax=Xylocopilactobacillus apicola TaxID=2932184 RepID=A0AAU9CXD9_9LACO|nr:S41 family peptidase [Xylocopilactobacillus apicola]BDR58649.1 peptidase S41 [Xylocopilactobacillus apicola]